MPKEIEGAIDMDKNAISVVITPNNPIDALKTILKIYKEDFGIQIDKIDVFWRERGMERPDFSLSVQMSSKEIHYTQCGE